MHLAMGGYANAYLNKASSHILDAERIYLDKIQDSLIHPKHIRNRENDVSGILAISPVARVARVARDTQPRGDMRLVYYRGKMYRNG